MPQYVTQCALCSKRETIYRTVEQRNNLDPCECGGEVSRIISAPTVIGDITPYISPTTGKLLSSKTDEQNEIAKHGYIIKEPGLEKDVARWGQEKKERDFAPIAAAVDLKVKELVNNSIIES